MRAVDLIIRHHLPADMQEMELKYDAKSIGRLLAQVAEQHPEQYGRMAKAIADTGREASYRQGETLTLSDFFPVVDRDKTLREMDVELGLAKKKLDPDAFKRERNKIWLKYADMLERDTSDKGLKAGNNLAYSTISGARGKAAQFKAMVTTPGIFEDHKSEIVPHFIRHSYAEGLTPAEYMASTFGARRSVVASKKAVAQGGDWGKLTVQAAARQIVTERDCGTNNGIDLPDDDNSLKRRVLSRDVAGFKAGTLIDRKVAGAIRKTAPGSVVVRSPLTCQSRDGICAKCAGALPDWKLPNVGDAVGIAAVQSLSEPIAQGSLNMKHLAGQASGKREYSGFDFISQFTQAPEEFSERATVAEADGIVDSVAEAPQGGTYVTISGEKHYVAPGFEVLVKPGEKVEAGDPLGDGLVNPSDVVRLRGVGEGRRYYASRLNKMLADSGFGNDARNSEMLARAAVDHVRVTGADDSAYLPDDTVSYNAYSASYTPPEDTISDLPGKGVGMYLQAPALHYTVGTRITPKVAEHLDKVNFGKVSFSPTQPEFEPEMIRLRVSAPEKEEDWLAAQHTSYLKKNFQDHAIRGSDTDTGANEHFAPRLAIGVGFGDKVHETGKF